MMLTFGRPGFRTQTVLNRPKLPTNSKRSAMHDSTKELQNELDSVKSRSQNKIKLLEDEMSARQTTAESNNDRSQLRTQITYLQSQLGEKEVILKRLFAAIVDDCTHASAGGMGEARGKRFLILCKVTDSPLQVQDNENPALDTLLQPKTTGSYPVAHKRKQ